MQVSVLLEHRFRQTPDGAVWSPTTFSHSFFQRYLQVFQSVKVLARVQQVERSAGDWQRADGENVEFYSLPYYVGPVEYVQKSRQVRQAIQAAFVPGDAVIMRISSTLAAALTTLLRQKQYPYAVEVITDPYVMFSRGVMRHPLQPYFQWWFTRQTRLQCQHAAGVSYVTANPLRERYPAQESAFTAVYTDAMLGDGAFVDQPRQFSDEQHSFKLVSVGSLDQMYKAPDVLIDAIAICREQGLDIELTWIGGGKHQNTMEAYAESRDLGAAVRFIGTLPGGDAVRARLDQADMMVHPSRTEGLPKAIIEGMARGLPVIASDVGGIPELLNKDDMVKPDDAQALANKLQQVVSNPNRLSEMAERNLEKAREYHEVAIEERRSSFYDQLRQATLAYQPNL